MTESSEESLKRVLDILLKSRIHEQVLHLTSRGLGHVVIQGTPSEIEYLKRLVHDFDSRSHRS